MGSEVLVRRSGMFCTGARAAAGLGVGVDGVLTVGFVVAARLLALPVVSVWVVPFAAA